MEADQPTSFEKALAKTESEAEATLKTATAAVNSLKKFRAAVQNGNLRDLPKTIEVAEQAISILRQQFTKAKESWDFDEGTYLSSRAFVSEILEAAKQIGVNIFEQDERLYCYPFLIRILAKECAIQIDKGRERRLRPAVLAKHLKKLQDKPVRFNSKALLESLFLVYSKIIGKDGQDTGRLVGLGEIYELLTSLPRQSREYSRKEFARDLYLLDVSGVRITRNGCNVNLHPPTGRGRASQIFSTVTSEGQVKRYSGISFTKDG